MKKPNPMKSHRSSQGYVYVMSAENGYVKIGSGGNPFERFSNIRGHSPIPVSLSYICKCRNPVDVEEAAHNALANHRKHGEWFDLPTESAVATLRAMFIGLGNSLAPLPNRSAECGARAVNHAAISEEAVAVPPSSKASLGASPAHLAASLLPNS